MEQKIIEQKLDDLLFTCARIFTVGSGYNYDAAINTEDAREYAKQAFNLALDIAADSIDSDMTYKCESSYNTQNDIIDNILKHKLK